MLCEPSPTLNRVLYSPVDYVLVGGGRIDSGYFDAAFYEVGSPQCTKSRNSRGLPGEGVEPSLPCGNWILSPARLPIPPSGPGGDIVLEQINPVTDVFE